MTNKTKFLTAPLIYFFLSLLGFGTLNHFGISYNDPRIHFYGIPMMLIISGFVWWINGHLPIKREDIKSKPSFLLLNWIPVLTVLMSCTALVEAVTSAGQGTKVLWAILLTFLIGFSEEGMFRYFLINQGLKKYSPLMVLLYSTLAFAFIHMANMAGGLDFKSALIQCIYTLPFGIISGILYMGTKNITAMVFWHMSVDFSLFLLELGNFKFASYFGYAIDFLLIFATITLIVKRLKSGRHDQKENG